MKKDFITIHFLSGITITFLSGAVVKNPPANAGDARDMALIPGSEGPLEIGNGNLLQYSWIEEPGGLQFMETQRIRHD